MDFHILGDGAYPMKSYVLKPFRDFGNQRRYNRIHSSVRVDSERGIGIYKSRWKRLTYVNTDCVKRARYIICVACVLHNFCIAKTRYLGK